jgi:hypothetical protein
MYDSFHTINSGQLVFDVFVARYPSLRIGDWTFFVEHCDNLILCHTGVRDSYHQPPLCAKCMAYPADFLTFPTKVIFLFFFNYFTCYLDFAVPFWQRWYSCSDLQPNESTLQFLYSSLHLFLHILINFYKLSDGQVCHLTFCFETLTHA